MLKAVRGRQGQEGGGCSGVDRSGMPNTVFLFCLLRVFVDGSITCLSYHQLSSFSVHCALPSLVSNPRVYGDAAFITVFSFTLNLNRWTRTSNNILRVGIMKWLSFLLLL